MSAIEESTCWDLIRKAAEGDMVARSRFAMSYLPLVHASLSARWRGRALRSEVDEAVQEVFLECFKEGGVIVKTSRDPPESFRAFLKTVISNVARRREVLEQDGRRRTPISAPLEELESRSASPGDALDGRWAAALLKEVLDLVRAWSRSRPEGRSDPVELLQLRFMDGTPVREIARRWNQDVGRLHRELARARASFMEAMAAVLARRGLRTKVEIDTAVNRLLEHLRFRRPPPPDSDGEGRAQRRDRESQS